MPAHARLRKSTWQLPVRTYATWALLLYHASDLGRQPGCEPGVGWYRRPGYGMPEISRSRVLAWRPFGTHILISQGYVGYNDFENSSIPGQVTSPGH